jgi:hypothetical protein
MPPAGEDSPMTRTALPLASVLLLPLAAAAGPPTVESVAPAVGQRGTEFGGDSR